MIKNFFILLFFMFVQLLCAQTKVSGKILDQNNQPVSYANVFFPDTTIGTISDEEGIFYLEDENTYEKLTISFIGYETQNIVLKRGANYDLKVILKEETSSLNQVVIVSGKQSKKNNPAIDILRKVWKNKRKNGVKLFDQYRYNQYEKLEFDINNVDSTLINSPIFKDLEFVFDYTDTSKISGKTYLPIFINEAVYKVYGDNKLNKEKLLLEHTEGQQTQERGGNNDKIILE